MMMCRRPLGEAGQYSIIPILIFLVFALVYYFSNRETVPITGRHQLVDMSREDEIALGLQAYEQVARSMRLIPSGADSELVRSVGSRIAKVSGVSDFQWEFNLAEGREANAFCLPGGKVVVSSGILPVAESADGLAVVMGHEIAHAIARHSAERMAEQKLLQLGQLAVGASIRDMGYEKQRAVMGVFGLGSALGVTLPFSRTHESEADHIGLLLLARACFHPEEAPRFWERMEREGRRGVPPEFLSTHPADARRIENLQSWLPEALAEREKYCGPRREAPDPLEKVRPQGGGRLSKNLPSPIDHF